MLGMTRPDKTELAIAIADNRRAIANAREVITSHIPCECSEATTPQVQVEVELDAPQESPVDPTVTSWARLRAWLGWTLRSRKA